MAALCGATPVLADVEAETFNLDPASFERAVRRPRRSGSSRARSYRSTSSACRPITTRSLPLPRRTGFFILDDAAQAFGATYKDRKLGAAFKGGKPGASAAATSFFPAKPLGCYGDGGAIFVDDDDLAARLQSLRVHGEGVDKYDAAGIGLAARLDTIQAAVLLEKLKIFPDEIVARDAAAPALRGRRSPASPIVPRVGKGRPRSGRNTPSGSRGAAGCTCGGAGGRKAFRPRSTTPSRCTGRRPIAASRWAEGGLPVSEQLAEPSDQPAYARLSRCADALTAYRGGARGRFRGTSSFRGNANGSGRELGRPDDGSARSPKSIITACGYGFRTRRCAAIRNDELRNNSLLFPS